MLSRLVITFLPRKIYSHIDFLNYRVCSGLVHWDDPEGWDGEGGGRGFRMGDTSTPMADSCQCMAKTTTIL